MNKYWQIITQEILHKGGHSNHPIRFTNARKRSSEAYKALQSANPKQNQKSYFRYYLGQLIKNIYLTHKETIVVLSGTSQMGKKLC